jgi:hypothetical protein
MAGSAWAAEAEGPTPGQIQAARALFADAVRDEDHGRWDAALEKLRRAATVKNTAGIRFHIALCEEKLGRLSAALNDYSASEALARVERNVEVQRALVEPLRMLGERVPTLTVAGPDAADAEIQVDGAVLPAGLVGVATPVDPGDHVVTARDRAHAEFRARVTLAERDHGKVEVAWARTPTLATPPAPSSVTPATHGGDRAQEPSSPMRSSSRTDGGAWIAALGLGAGAVVVAGLGVGAWAVADASADRAQSDCAARPSPCEPDLGASRVWRGVAIGAWAAGAALGVTAVVVAWPSPSDPGLRTTARLGVGPGSLSAALSF